MPSSSISSSELAAVAAYTPTTASLRVTQAARRRRAGALFVRAAALLAIAVLPVTFSALVDPARLVASRESEREIARVLATGRNVTDVANYDDRAIERFLAPLRRERPEILGLGSSRMQPMPASAFAGRRFVNGAMQAGVLDDALGVYGLYDLAGRRPGRVVLSVDPWTESYDGAAGWGALADERAMVMRRAGIAASPQRERLALLATKLRTLATPEYFRLAMYSLRRHGMQGIPWRVTDQAQGAEKTKLPDGSVVWPVVSAERASAAASAFASSELPHDERFRDLGHRAAGRDRALEKFVRYLRSEGVSVTVLLVPFAPEVYDAAGRLRGRTIMDVEREVRAMSARLGVEVRGSYDPRVVGVTTSDFFDESHLRPEPLARLVSGSLAIRVR